MDKTRKDRLVMPKKPPYKLTSEYLDSKVATRQFIKLYNCGDDISSNNVRNTNYFAKQELIRIEKLLNDKREVTAKRKVELDQQWEDLEKRENDLREMFIKFNKFIAENEDKRTRAEKKILQLTSVRESREEQIEVMNEECSELEKIKEEMTKKIIEYKLYEDYLNEVVRMCPGDFSEIIDILHRYELIKHTSQQLGEHQTLDLDHLAEAQHEFAKIVERYMVQLTGLNTQVALLQQRHDAAKRDCQKWEELYERVRARATDLMVDIVSIKDSCGRIYREICERKGVEPVFKDNYEKQLDVIKKTLRHYRGVNELAKRVAAEGLLASQRPCVSKETD